MLNNASTSIRWTLNVLTTAAMAVLMFAPGCGGDEASTAANPYKYMTVDDFCAGAAEAQCSATVVKNCSPPGDTADAQRLECMRDAFAACKDDQYKSDVDVTYSDDPDRTSGFANYYRPAVAEACVTALKTGYSDASLTADELKAIKKGCSPVFSKAYDVDAPCSTDQDCDSSKDLKCLRPSATSSSGVCKKPNPRKAGEDCTSATDECVNDAGDAEGFYCDPEVGICRTSRTVGQKCFEFVTGTCGEGMQCIKATEDATETTCQNKLQNQEFCNTGRGEECNSGVCVPTYDGFRCFNSLDVAQASQACTYFDGKLPRTLRCVAAPRGLKTCGIYFGCRLFFCRSAVVALKKKTTAKTS